MAEKQNNLISINCGTYFYFGILHSKSVILLGLCLVLHKIYFRQCFLSGFKVDYPVNLWDLFFLFLVLLYICPNSKPLKILCTFCTRVYDSINNYDHHGKKQLRQEFEYGFIFIKIWLFDQYFLWYIIKKIKSNGWTY